MKNETPARVVFDFLRERFESNENRDDEFLSFTV